MKKMLGLLMMMLLAVCVTSCGTNYARPDRCVCESEPVPVVAPAPEPEPQSDDPVVPPSIDEMEGEYGGGCIEDDEDPLG